VLWQGGSSHHEDLFEITEELGRVAARHPNVKFIFFGAKFSWIMAAIPEAQREHIEWVGFEEHRMKLATIPHDIALCPLRKNEFNDCKSAIKWYESSLRQKPAAVLASNWGPYRDEMEDGVTGLLYDTPGEFEQKLELLIADAELRARLGDAAQQWIWANRDASVTVPPLRDAMLERRARMLVDRRVFVERTVKECPALFKKG
jgi:glycosyltransferase involved in cell wall biosynthesis